MGRKGNTELMLQFVRDYLDGDMPRMFFDMDFDHYFIVSVAYVVFGVLLVKFKGWQQYVYLSVAAMNFALMLIGGADAGKVGTLGAIVLLIPYWIYTRKNTGKVLILSSSFGFVYCLHHWFMMNVIMPEWTEENRPIQDILYKNDYPVLPFEYSGAKKQFDR